MNAIVTVIGKDRCGIIAEVSSTLAKADVNIEDISQTVLSGNFTMIMLCNVPEKVSIAELSGLLEQTGTKIGVSIRVQHEDIFNAMHKI